MSSSNDTRQGDEKNGKTENYICKFVVILNRPTSFHDGAGFRLYYKYLHMGSNPLPIPINSAKSETRGGGYNDKKSDTQ